MRGSNRQERSEGRERDSAVIQVLLHYAELASMRVGVPCYKDGAFKSLNLKFIAEKAGFRKIGDHAAKGRKYTKPLRAKWGIFGLSAVWFLNKINELGDGADCAQKVRFANVSYWTT